METPVNANKQTSREPVKQCPERPGKGKNRVKDRHCNPVKKIPDNIGTEL